MSFSIFLIFWTKFRFFVKIHFLFIKRTYSSFIIKLYLRYRGQMCPPTHLAEYSRSKDWLSFSPHKKQMGQFPPRTVPFAFVSHNCYKLSNDEKKIFSFGAKWIYKKIKRFSNGCTIWKFLLSLYTAIKKINPKRFLQINYGRQTIQRTFYPSGHTSC